MNKLFFPLCAIAMIIVLDVTAALAAEPGKPAYIPFEMLSQFVEQDDFKSETRTRSRFRTLPGIIATVEVSMIDPVRNSALGKEVDALRETLAKDITETLCSRGIQVLDYTDWKSSDSKPVLLCFLSFSNDTFIMWLQYEEQFVLARNPSVYKYMRVWYADAFSSCPGLLDADTTQSKAVILSQAGELLEDFVTVYREANPTSQPTRKALPLTAAEQTAVNHYMQEIPNAGLKGLTDVLPVVEIMSNGGYGRPSPLSSASISMSEKAVNKCLMCFKRCGIPCPSISEWEKNPFKTYMKITLSADSQICNFILFDRFILKRDPADAAYWAIWGYTKFENATATKAQIMQFQTAHSTEACKTLMRDYREMNPKSEARQ